MSTHDTNRFGREKAAAGLAFIQSPAYRSIFGSNSGRWLILTFGGERRLKNLMKQTEHQARNHSNLFFFAGPEILKANVFTEPIWQQAGKPEHVSLFS